jgi:hypothetical protein
MGKLCIRVEVAGMFDDLIAMSEPWLEYAIRRTLLGQPSDELSTLRGAALQDEKLRGYLQDITDFHGVLVRNHKDPGLPIHKLLFLLDAGFGTEVPEIGVAIGHIMDHKDIHGVFQSSTNIPKHYGGKGEDVFGWCLCDAPLLLLGLLKAGIDYQQHVKKGVDHLLGLHSHGFPCTVSAEHGSFRGPGRKGDCCPYATLIMVNLMAETTEYKDSLYAQDCVETLLSLWENSHERHPYMFYMGTDFRKLKAPLMWYDILSVTDCLSKFAYVHDDSRFLDMVSIIEAKRGGDGMFTPESVYLKFKGWDFGQKKIASPYLTYLCLRLFARLDRPT